MQVASTMIGATGEFTFSGVVQQAEDGRFHAVARVFDHPDPSVSLPSGTTPRHLVEIEAATLEEAKRSLEAGLVARLGALEWVRWSAADGRTPGRT